MLALDNVNVLVQCCMSSIHTSEYKAIHDTFELSDGGRRGKCQKNCVLCYGVYTVFVK